jgi:hypothetical protein
MSLKYGSKYDNNAQVVQHKGEGMKTCMTCRFRRPESYPTMDGPMDGCSIFSMYEEDMEYSGIYNDRGFLIDTDKYSNIPFIFAMEEAGMAIPEPSSFGCMLHEDA